MSVAITIWPRPAQICIYVRFCWHKEYINIGSLRSRLLVENLPFFHFYNGKRDISEIISPFLVFKAILLYMLKGKMCFG